MPEWFDEAYATIREAHMNGFMSLATVHRMIVIRSKGSVEFHRVIVPKEHKDDSWRWRFRFLTTELERPAEQVFVANTLTNTHCVVVKANKVYNPSDEGDGVLKMTDAVSKDILKTDQGGVGRIWRVVLTPEKKQKKMSKGQRRRRRKSR